MASTRTMLSWALEYASAGLPVVPLHSVSSDGRCSCGNRNCAAPGKHPRTRKGLKEATTDLEQIKKWWSKDLWPNASIGGVGGAFLCLDVDAKSGGLDSLEALIRDNAPLPETAVALTGEYSEGRGRHYWFRVPEGVRVASKVGVREGIDIRGEGGYAVLPPSPHISGVRYEWIVPFEEVAYAPAWLLDLAPKPVEGEASWSPNPNFRMSREVKLFLRGEHEIPRGEQRLFLCRAARSVLTTGKSVKETSRLLYEGYNGDGGILSCEQDPDNPWRLDQIQSIVEDEYRKGPNTPLEKDFNTDEIYLTDIGNGKRLVASYEEGHLFHVSEWGKWYIWDKNRFIEDDGTALRLRWEQVTRDMIREAADMQDEDAAKRLFAHALKSQSRPRVEAAVWAARDMVRRMPSELNADPFLLNCQNGILDLRDGTLHKPDPKYLMTKQVRAVYDPSAESDLWNRVLEDLIPERELREFMQKVFGYTLTASTDEHKFFYLHGPPGAGKTTLLEAFSYLMGNYAETAEPDTFMLKRGQTSGGPSEDIARLSNARMVVTHEVEEGSRFAEAKVAHLTGGDKVTARFLHQNSFEFRPKFKLFFSANHKPRVSGSSESGIWRRLIIIPIDRVIPEEERDPTLLQRLRKPEHLSAMLAWAVEGCRKWMKDHEAGRLMEVPEIVKDEIAQYRVESDHILEFLQEAIVQTGNDKDRIPKPEMYDLYLGWCAQAGRRQTVTKHMLTRRLKSTGLKSKPALCDGRVQDCWVGVRAKVPQIRGKE